MRGHAEERADRHDAGTADAGDEDAVRLGQVRQRRFGERRQLVLGRFCRMDRPRAFS
jgi:hypothetical protein